jgi:branched-chain amino acid transport system substrate-binding protein
VLSIKWLTNLLTKNVLTFHGMLTKLAIWVGIILFSGAALGAEGDNSVKIGLTVSQSGVYREPSAMIYAAFKIWEQETNARGGLLNRPVRLIVYDDQSKPELVGQLYRQLIDKDGVDLVFSPYGTPLTLAASEVTESHQYVMLACGASGEAIWSRGYKYIFGIYAPAKRYFIGFLDLIARHGLSSVAIVAEDTSFNLSCAQGVREWAPRFGLQVTLNRVYQKGEEFPGIIQEIGEQRPDSVILCSYPDDGYLFLQESAKASHRPQTLCLAITPSYPDFGRRVGDMAEGIFGSSQWEPVSRMPFPGSREFIEKFQAATGQLPQYHAASAYAAGELLAKAVTAVGSLDQKKIRDFIQSLDTVTIIGRFKVDHTGLQIGHNPLIIQWQQGQKEIVYPTTMQSAPPRIDLPGKTPDP